MKSRMNQIEMIEPFNSIEIQLKLKCSWNWIKVELDWIEIQLKLNWTEIKIKLKWNQE